MRVSVERLFGHLCCGSTFAHDEEMKMLARQRDGETLKRHTNDRKSQTMTSLRDGSVDHQDKSPMSLMVSTSDPESQFLDDLERVPKRQRTSLSLSGNRRGGLDTSPPTAVLPPKQKISDIKQSFESFFGQSKKEKILQTSKSTDPPSNYGGSCTGTSRTAVFDQQGSSAIPHLENDPKADFLHNERSTVRPVDVHCGTRAEPIGLSDDDPSGQGNEKGVFLQEEMPEPDDIINTLNESQVDHETQVTLSDAAFWESQSSQNSNPDVKAMRLLQRKEAYKAAKEPSGKWKIDHGLISSDAHHGEAELEL